MIQDFFSGLSYFGKGWRFLGANKRLYKFILIPLLINAALFASLGFLIFHYYSPLFGHINERLGTLTSLEGGWANSVLSGVLWFFSGILRVVVGIVLLALMVFAFYVLSQIINSPFYELLSEATEKIASSRGEELPFSWSRLFKETRHAVILEIKKMGFFLFVPALLLVLNIVPIVGSLLYTVIANAFAAFAFGFNYFTYPLSRKQWTFSSQLRHASRHKAHLMGLGLLLMIPFFNLLFAPLFVIGGTLLHLDLGLDDASPSSPAL